MGLDKPKKKKFALNKRRKCRLNDNQKDFLEYIFDAQTRNPTHSECVEYSEILRTFSHDGQEPPTARTVKLWFKRKRAKK